MKLWIAFLVGLLVNVLRQANLVASSRPDKNPIEQERSWVKRNAIGLLVRGVFDVATWAVLTYNPQLFLNRTITIPGTTFTVTVNVPLVWPVALFGAIVVDLFWDFVIEHWSWLKSKMPPLNGSGAPQEPPSP